MNHNQPPTPHPDDETTRLINEVAATMGGGSIEPATQTHGVSKTEGGASDFSVRLPEQHRRALQEKVDVRLCFGRHGLIDVIPGHGVAVLGVEDKHYAEIARFVQQLDSSHGDTLGLESTGFESEFSSDEFLDQIRDYFLHSKYMTEEDIRAMFQTDKDRSPTLVWEKARRLQIIDPFEYGVGLALSKGVQVRYADAQASEHSEPDDYSAKSVTDNDLNRDARTIERLGQIADAIETEASPERKPMVGLLRGKHHGPNIEEFLRKENIPFTTDVEGKARSEARIWLQTLANVALRKGGEGRILDYRKKWLNNLPKDY